MAWGRRQPATPAIPMTGIGNAIRTAKPQPPPLGPGVTSAHVAAARTVATRAGAKRGDMSRASRSLLGAGGPPPRPRGSVLGGGGY